jgi:hypothetical protein
VRELWFIQIVSALGWVELDAVMVLEVLSWK